MDDCARRLAWSSVALLSASTNLYRTRAQTTRRTTKTRIATSSSARQRSSSYCRRHVDATRFRTATCRAQLAVRVDADMGSNASPHRHSLSARQFNKRAWHHGRHTVASCITPQKIVFEACASRPFAKKPSHDSRRRLVWRTSSHSCRHIATRRNDQLGRKQHSEHS